MSSAAMLTSLLKPTSFCMLDLPGQCRHRVGTPGGAGTLYGGRARRRGSVLIAGVAATLRPGSLLPQGGSERVPQDQLAASVAAGTVSRSGGGRLARPATPTGLPRRSVSVAWRLWAAPWPRCLGSRQAPLRRQRCRGYSGRPLAAPGGAAMWAHHRHRSVPGVNHLRQESLTPAWIGSTARETRALIEPRRGLDEASRDVDRPGERWRN
jgi:hypothetical protein